MKISPVIVDLYANDLNGHPDLEAFVAAGLPWCGIGLKATEGTYYPKDASWFKKYWPAVKDTFGDRYGVDGFRMAYHYFRVDQDPVKQADFYLALVERAGGWGAGDLWPVVDVESAENPEHASAQQVIDAVSKYAARIHELRGLSPILYAGSYLRDRNITDHMGCSHLWCAIYSSTLPAHYYADMGWTLDELFAWQYQGTEASTGPDGYPRECPIGKGPLDLSAVTIAGGGDDALAYIRANACVMALT